MTNFGTYLITVSNLFSILHSASIPKREWLSFCHGDDKRQYIIHDTKPCSAGVFFKKPLSNLCVCANGIWQLKEATCSDSVFIDAEDGDCFRIRKPIRWIRYLGVTYEPRKEFNFVTGKASFEIFNIDDRESMGGYTKAFALNARKRIQDCAEEECFELGKSVDSTYNTGEPVPRILWDYIPNGRSVYSTTQCSSYYSPKPFTYGVPFRGMYDGKFHRSLEAHSNECAERCFPPFKNMSFDDNYWGDSRVNSSKGVISIEELIMPPEPEDPIPDPTLKPAKLNTSVTGFPTNEPGIGSNPSVNCSDLPVFSDVGRSTKNNFVEQTKRIVTAHFDSVLLGKRAPLINLTEYDYHRTGRVIFEKAVPDSEVSHKLLRKLLIWFRVALNESMAVYPYEHVGDDLEDERLWKALNTCMADAGSKAFTVKYADNKCPPKFEGIYYVSNSFRLPVNSMIPCDLAYNSSALDYSLEVAWKIVMFTHYYCSSYFNKTAYDHSRLEYKLRKLFNQQIIARWYHPVGARRAMVHVFKEHDLHKFMVQMDRFVAAAKYISAYKKWIKRPKYEDRVKRRRTRSVTSSMITVLNGTGYCVADHDQLDLMGGSSCTTKLTNPICTRKLKGRFLIMTRRDNTWQYWRRDGSTTTTPQNCSNSQAIFEITPLDEDDIYIIKSLVGKRWNNFLFDDEGLRIKPSGYAPNGFTLKGVNNGMYLGSYNSIVYGEQVQYIQGCDWDEFECLNNPKNAVKHIFSPCGRLK